MKIAIHEVTFTVSFSHTDTEQDSPLSGDIEEAILNDLDAQLEDECLESLWAV